MALDQVHEQNSGKIKGASGATHLLNRADVSRLERWETCTPEIARIIESLEENSDLRSTPFSRRGSKEHTKQTCLQSSRLWKENEKSVA